MKKRRIIFLIITPLLLIGILTFFGEKGILHLIKIRKELYRIEQENKRLEEENKKLSEEIRRLKQDKRYIEEIARKELGMVKEDEIIYQFDLQDEKK
jgi:cell division protein FtsL